MSKEALQVDSNRFDNILEASYGCFLYKTYAFRGFPPCPDPFLMPLGVSKMDLDTEETQRNA